MIENMVSNESGNINWIYSIASPLIGVVIGFFLNVIQSNRGNIQVFCNDNELSYYGYDRQNHSGRYLTHNFEEVEHVKIDLDVDVVNNFETRKVFRDIMAVVITRSAIHYVKYYTNEMKIPNSIVRDKYRISHFNIEAKSMYNIRSVIFLHKDEIVPKEDIVKIFIVFKDEKNRSFKKLLLRTNDIKYVGDVDE